MVRPGEIYWADFNDAAPHPVLILSREELNRGRTAVAVFITSSGFEKRSRLPNCVPLRAGRFGLTKDCVAQCEAVVALDLGQIESGKGPIGVLDESTLRDVVRAVGYVMDATCEPA